MNTVNTEQVVSMWKEFKTFILRGNVIDMAVGLVMGAAFKKIVDSLVADILMPLIGILTNGIDFGDLKAVIYPAVVESGNEVQPELAIRYGAWIQTIVEFLIISIFIFLFVKFANKLHRKKEEAPVEVKKSDDVVLLEEIRDELKNLSAR